MIDNILTQLGIASTEHEYIILLFKCMLSIIIITEFFGWLKLIFSMLKDR